jgi:ferredoxin-type protein NapF
MNRLQFLRGQYSAEPVLRPPWSLPEDRFVDQCERCDRCIHACPGGIIRRGAAGFPEMDFSSSGCDFCGDCVDACPDGALQRNSAEQEPWLASIEINSLCFAQRGIVCRSCGEVCESRALSFSYQVGGTTRIDISAQRCTGCGECVSICPARAMAVKPVQSDSRQEAQS